jgi:hypothetical protein
LSKGRIVGTVSDGAAVGDGVDGTGRPPWAAGVVAAPAAMLAVSPATPATLRTAVRVRARRATWVTAIALIIDPIPEKRVGSV